MILAIDIGNTNITFGVFRGGKLIKKWKIRTYMSGTNLSFPPPVCHSRPLSVIPAQAGIFHQGAGSSGNLFAGGRLQRESGFPIKTFGNDIFRPYNSKWPVQSIIISSVVPEALKRIKKALKGVGGAKVLVVGEDIEVPIKNLYKIKRQVGQDRLVNAYAVKELYGAPAVIIDFGTAITFDVVSGKGEYLGGLIMPGIEMGLESLYKNTALLPKVKLMPAKHIIGKDTASSMRGGILFGYGAMCDGLVSAYKKILGRELKVVATGGNASLIKKYSKSIQIVDENLTLKGLSKLAS